MYCDEWQWPGIKDKKNTGPRVDNIESEIIFTVPKCVCVLLYIFCL